MKKNVFLNLNKQNGQALLIVVLVMVIALTVGLSIASKTITSFRNSTDSVNSQKALSAAEAGIEQAIKTNATIANGSSIPLGDSNYTTTVSQVDGTTFLLNGGNAVSQDSGIDLWLTPYSSDSAKLYNTPYVGSFTVYWGDSKEDNSEVCKNAALEVVAITGTKASPVISRYAFDPCDSRRGASINLPGNHFDSPAGQGPPIAGKTFYYQATISVADGGLIARIVPLYKSTVIGVSGTSVFPSQGSTITSIGSSGTTQRKVSVFQGYPELPAEYYLYNLFVP